MRVNASPRLAIVAVIAVILGSVFPSGRIASAQARMDELPAAWGDLDTWSRYIPATDETEVGLGLKPAGPDAPMLVAFSARLKGASPSEAPGDIFVHVSAGVQGRHRSNTLKFVLKPTSSGSPSATANGYNAPVIDLSSRLGADDGSPGARVNFATARIAAAEFLRIARSGATSATILGVDVTFRPDQLRAIRAFGNRIFLKAGEPR